MDDETYFPVPDEPRQMDSVGLHDITVVGGIFDTDAGLKFMVPGDDFPRLWITSQGKFLRGDGTYYPLEVARIPGPQGVPGRAPTTEEINAAVLLYMGAHTEDLRGVQGFDAYQVAQQIGYSGTRAEWVASLRGPQGTTGATGADSTVAGPTGKSAYQVAQTSGYAGTEAQWLLSLKGVQGDPGAAGTPAPTNRLGAKATDTINIPGSLAAQTVTKVVTLDYAMPNTSYVVTGQITNPPTALLNLGTLIYWCTPLTTTTCTFNVKIPILGLTGLNNVPISVQAQP